MSGDERGSCGQTAAAGWDMDPGVGQDNRG